MRRSSSAGGRTSRGEWLKAPGPQPRGLTRNGSCVVPHLLTGAATPVSRRGEPDEPWERHDVQRLEGGTNPPVARVTMARQIASLVLSLWRDAEEDDPQQLAVLAVPRGA